MLDSINSLGFCLGQMPSRSNADLRQDIVIDSIVELGKVHACTEAALSGGIAMQTVWSRVAQVRRVCHCPSCQLTTNGIARRATTATARRTVRVGDVFTLSLSSLAAGFAFADSRRKDKRRQQWDKVIKEARATVEATEIQQQNRLVALSEARVEALEDPSAARYNVSAERGTKEVEVWDAQESEGPDQRVLSPNNRTDDHRNDTWLDVFEWAREQKKIREIYGFQDWKGPPLSLLQSLSWAQLDELLSNEWLLRRFYGGPDCHSLMDEPPVHPYSMKKVRTLEWSVAKMGLKLLMYGFRNSLLPWEDSESRTTSLLAKLLDGETIHSKLDHIEQRLSTLHADRRSQAYYETFDRPPLPNYHDYHDVTMGDYEQTTALNTSLQDLLNPMEKRMDSGDLISKICYNLLTARTPPNIHTYNMLLVHLCALGKNDPAKAVFYSMLESHIRPNEITHVTLLRYFTTRDDRLWFFKYTDRMEGRGKGLALANPELSIHPTVRQRYQIHGRFYHKAFEKGRMNGQVYESLIVGAMHFFSDQLAMRYYRNMISEGWSPRLEIFLAILQDCCRRLDWAVGIAVLEQLERSAVKMNTLAYEWMLRLCQCCGQQGFFDQILMNGVQCGALPVSMLYLPDHAKSEDIAFLIERAKGLQPRKAIGTLMTTAARMTHRLFDQSPFLLGNVFHDCEDEDMVRHTLKVMRKRWRARRAFEKRLKIISTDIEYTILQANHALYAWKHMSSVRFWLSRRIKYLKQDHMQEANHVAYALDSDVMKHQKVQITTTQASSAEDKDVEKGRDDESTDSVESPLSACFPEQGGDSTHLVPGDDQRHKEAQRSPTSSFEYEYAEVGRDGKSSDSVGLPLSACFPGLGEYLSRAEPARDRQHRMYQWKPPNVIPTTHTPGRSFRRDPEKQIAATA